MKRQRQRGWWYPWIFVGGMAVVIAVNAVLIVMAVSTFPGFETRDHYQRGIAYNDAIAGSRAQAALGWTASITFEIEPPAEAATAVKAESGVRAGRIVATVKDRTGAALSGIEVAVRLVRPTHDGFDTEATLIRRSDGAYARDVNLPLPGQWDAHLIARKDGTIFQESHRLFVP